MFKDYNDMMEEQEKNVSHNQAQPLTLHFSRKDHTASTTHKAMCDSATRASISTNSRRRTIRRNGYSSLKFPNSWTLHSWMSMLSQSMSDVSSRTRPLNCTGQMKSSLTKQRFREVRRQDGWWSPLQKPTSQKSRDETCRWQAWRRRRHSRKNWKTSRRLSKKQKSRSEESLMHSRRNQSIKAKTSISEKRKKRMSTQIRRCRTPLSRRTLTRMKFHPLSEWWSSIANFWNFLHLIQFNWHY